MTHTDYTFRSAARGCRQLFPVYQKTKKSPSRVSFSLFCRPSPRDEALVCWAGFQYLRPLKAHGTLSHKAKPNGLPCLHVRPCSYPGAAFCMRSGLDLTRLVEDRLHISKTMSRGMVDLCLDGHVSCQASQPCVSSMRKPTLG